MGTETVSFGFRGRGRGLKLLTSLSLRPPKDKLLEKGLLGSSEGTTKAERSKYYFHDTGSIHPLPLMRVCENLLGKWMIFSKVLDILNVSLAHLSPKYLIEQECHEKENPSHLSGHGFFKLN